MLRYLLLLSLTGLLVSAAVAVYALSEARRLTGRNHLLEEQVPRLETALAQAIHQRDEVSRFLDERVEDLRDQRSARDQRTREAFRPMPEGVRLALVALNRTLAEDGFPELRFLAAQEVRDRALHGVELLDHEAASLATTLYLADRLTLHLDRRSSELSIRLFDGKMVGGEGSTEFDESGHAVVLGAVNGPAWESRLGYLLHVAGDYPAPASTTAAAREALDRFARAEWLDRLNRLLATPAADGADGGVTYRVLKIDGLRDGVFTQVMVGGYESGHTLGMAIEAERMSIVVRDRDASVELRLEAGVVRKAGGETRIGPAGYGILLPSVSERAAMETMLGMVVRQ